MIAEYTLCYTPLCHAGGRVPDSWRKLLEERGFIDEEGELSPEAYSVLETLTETPRRPVITRAIATALLSLPEGPAEKKLYQPKFLDTLEASELLVRSVPHGQYMALTRAGRLLRRALMEANVSADVPVLVNQLVYEALEALLRGDEVDREVREMLGAIGFVTGAGALTRAGRLV